MIHLNIRINLRWPLRAVCWAKQRRIEARHFRNYGVTASFPGAGHNLRVVRSNSYCVLCGKGWRRIWMGKWWL